MYTLLPPNALPYAAEYVRSEWLLKVPHGITLDDLMTPAFWAHHVNRVRINDRIEAVADDGSFDVEFRVIDKDVGFVKMRMLRAWTGEKVAKAPAVEEQPMPTKFPCVDFRKATGWRLLGHDGKQVKTCASEQDAQRELAAYLNRSKAA